LVVFDFDGTLAETRDAVSTTVNAALLAHQLPRVSPPFIHRLMGLPLETLFERMLPPTVKPYDVQPLVDGYREQFDALGAPKVTPMPGAISVLDSLGWRGIPVAIATSRGRASVHQLLEQLGWSGRFVAVVTCDDVAAGKPDPETLLRALDGAGVSADEAWMVGDTTWDIQMAKQAGVYAVGVAAGCHHATRLERAGPDLLLDDVDAVLAHLDDA
jgi:phosphoglycolate phosphatase